MTHLFTPISSSGDPQFQVEMQLRSPNSQIFAQIGLKAAHIARWHLKVAQNDLKINPMSSKLAQIWVPGTLIFHFFRSSDPFFQALVPLRSGESEIHKAHTYPNKIEPMA